MDCHPKLSDLIQAIDSYTEDHLLFLHKTTGQIVCISIEAFHTAKMGYPLQRYPTWQQEKINQARSVWEQFDEYVQLPLGFGFEEIEVAENFCYSIDDDKICEYLLRLVKGKVKLRKFKERLKHLRLNDDWNDYLDETIRTFTIRWCEDNQIRYVDE